MIFLSFCVLFRFLELLIELKNNVLAEGSFPVLIIEQFWLHFVLIFLKTESNLSKEMELVIKDIKNTTQKKYMDYGKNPGSPDNDFLFMYSVAR